MVLRFCVSRAMSSSLTGSRAVSRERNGHSRPGQALAAPDRKNCGNSAKLVGSLYRRVEENSYIRRMLDRGSGGSDVEESATLSI